MYPLGGGMVTFEFNAHQASIAVENNSRQNRLTQKDNNANMSKMCNVIVRCTAR